MRVFKSWRSPCSTKIQVRAAQSKNLSSILFSNLNSSRHVHYTKANPNQGMHIDAHEVKKFQSVKSDWWVPSSTKGTGPLHSMNPARVSFIERELQELLRTKPGSASTRRPLEGLAMVDVGCGGGILAESLSRMGAAVTGIDPGEENILAAETHASLDPETSQISYEATTVDDFVTTGAKFDAVCSLEVIEHVPQPSQFVKSLCSLAQPNGSVFVSTINRTAKSYLITILGAEYLTRQIPVGTHDWNKYITPTELCSLFEKAGAEVVNITGLIYNPLCNTWTLDKNDTDVNYIIHAKVK